MHSPLTSQESASSEGSNTIAFLGGFMHVTKEDDVRKYTEQFGEVATVMYPINRRTGLPKGFAKVQFTQHSYLKNLLRCKSHVLHNAKINASAWVPKSEFDSKKEKPSKKIIYQVRRSL